MRERPINERGPMVRAILEGRKTQTRRIVKPQPPATAHPFYIMCSSRLSDEGKWRFTENKDHTSPTVLGPLACPYGKPGDRLWVRETYADDPWEPGDSRVLYRADNPPASAFDPDRGDRWRHSIYMPRWASRITLDITGTRLERLQDISEADALAEGYDPQYPYSPQEWFSDLWKSINGSGSWHSDPWVWVIEYPRLTTPTPL